MAYSITQARPLLNAAELELFDQSRAAPIKSLTLARLRTKVTRVRALRDKYRDLFRRQTVAVRKAPATKSRSPVGADNERTQRKADILQEVLDRFEARVAQLEAQEARGAASGASAKVAPKRPKAGTSSSTRKAAADRSGETTANAAAKNPAAAKQSARSHSAGDSNGAARAKTASAAGKGSGAKSTSGSRSKPSAPAAAPAAGTQRTVPSAKKKATVTTLPPAAPVLQPVLADVLNQHATRSPKAPSDMAPTANGKAQAPQSPAPVSLVPAALRGNPLKQAPGQIAIHAYQGSSVRRAQGKRDSR